MGYLNSSCFLVLDMDTKCEYYLKKCGSYIYLATYMVITTKMWLYAAGQWHSMASRQPLKLTIYCLG